MTDDHLDDLASAYLDGVASPEETARVEADPAVLARVAELANVRAALQQAPRVDPTRRAAALAAALAAFEGEAADASAAVSLASRRARRTWSPRTVRLVGAAAAVLVLAALVPLLGRFGDDDSPQAARFEETGAAIGDANAGDGSEGTASEADALSTTTTDAAGFDFGADLGDFDTVDDLLAAVAHPTPQATSAPNEAGALSARDHCPPTDDAAAAHQVSARLDGEPVVVVVERSTEDARTATVYRLADCRRLGGGPLP